MKQWLIIPDIHGRQFWKNAVSQYEDKVEKVIFLGDYLDPYECEGITRKNAIRNFEEIIDYKINNKNKVVLLLGNHDLHYWSKEFHTRSRYDSSNAYHIIEDFKTHRSLFELAHEETIGNKKYLFSHAGLMNSWVERNKKVIDEITPDSLTRLLYSANGIRALTDVSSYRTWFGEDSGSIVWSDVREKIDLDDSIEYNIIPNDDSIVKEYDYQIFGHTQQSKNPMITDKWACLDCRKAFILDENGVLTQVTEEKTE
jgi:predicted phosphodiesterase